MLRFFRKRVERLKMGSTLERAQSTVEFALVLPFLLILIFGIIEFARIMQAYLAIENGARWGVRYAVTGDYDPSYCEDAANALGYLDEDLSDGVVDCRVSESIEDHDVIESALTDFARLPSIRDASLKGAVGISVSNDEEVTGNYLDFLKNPQASMSEEHRGNPGEKRYLGINICSNRYNPETDTAYRLDPNPFYYPGHEGEAEYQYPVYCQAYHPSDGSVAYYTDNAGAPGNRVQVRITLRHQLITPIISGWWPTIKIEAVREGIVEKFRTSRVSGLTNPLSLAPTWTPIPPTATTTPTATLSPTAAPCSGGGTILREVWEGVGGNGLSALESLDRYPDEPHFFGYLGSYEAPTNVMNEYGQRVHGYVCAPYTGQYTFYIASDDNSELYISTNENPENAVQIAKVPGWTNSRVWDKYPSDQQSIPLNLVAGNWYYISAIMKEGGGGDNLAVGWVGPHTLANPDPVVIEGQYLRPAPESLVPTRTVTPSLTKTTTPTRTLTPTLTPTPVWVDCNGTGALREIWWGIEGNATSYLTADANYPWYPDVQEIVTDLEMPNNIANNYGQRLRTYYCAPYTGDYRFWVSSNNVSELYFNSNGTDPSNTTRIARVSGSTNVSQWNRYSDQKSSVISLQAGQLYYMDVLHKEGSASDHLQVGVSYYGSSDVTDVEIIGQDWILPYEPGDPPPAPKTCRNTGSLLREYWLGISGTNLTNLTGNSNYPSNPSGYDYISSASVPINWTNNYGNRVRGWVCPPYDGDYTFYLASNNYGELYLSTSSRERDAVRVAYVYGYTGREQWDKYASQQSVTLTLRGGREYYIEIIHKEGTSSDHAMVGWFGPYMEQIEIIDGQYLIPDDPLPTRTPTITRTATATSPPTRTPTTSRTPTITRTPTRTLVPSRTPIPSITRTPTKTATRRPTRTPTRTVPATRTPTRTTAPTRTRTPIPSKTNTRPPTKTPTKTVPVTPTPSPTPPDIG